MITYRTFIDNINCLFTIPEVSNGNIIINCSGLPGQPENYELFSYFTQQGFICIHPKYEGTWESYGKFLEKSPVEDIIKVIDYVSEKRSLKSAYDSSTINLNFKNIFLFGSSFGASVALVAHAKTSSITGVVAIAPVTNFVTQGGGEDEEQDLTNLGTFLREGYGRAYDFELDNWQKLLEGEIDINPVNYKEELSSKCILLLHGENDKTVSIQKTKDFFENIE